MNTAHPLSELLRQAMEQLESGQLNDAAVAIKEALRLEPSNPNALHLSGLVAKKTGDTVTAVTNIEAAIKISPSAQMHYNLGLLLSQQNEFKAAGSHFRRATELNPNFGEALEKLGQVEVRLGDPTGALEAFQFAVKLRPDADTYHAIGMLLGSKGERDAAVDAYQEALLLEPERASTHNNLGVIYGAMGDPDRAIGSFQAAIKSDPKYLSAMINLGLVWRLQNQLTAAEACFNRVLTVAPQHAVTHNY